MNLTEDKIDALISDIKTVVKQWGANKVSILTILFTVFATLKLSGCITWSWWWVTAPLWGGLIFSVFILILIALILFLAYMLKK